LFIIILLLPTRFKFILKYLKQMYYDVGGLAKEINQ